MRPIGNRVVLEYVKIDEVKHGNLYLPRLAVADNVIWRVASVGDEVKYVKPGDYVIVPVHVLQEIDLHGRKFAVVREEHIYAILTEKELYPS